jgi:GxxExxY protein
MNHQGTKTPIQPIPASTDRVAKEIVDDSYKIHATLGPGLLESVYEQCMLHELIKRGLRVERQVCLPILYDGLRIEGGLRLDLVVNSCVVAELKAVEKIVPVHKAQVLTYLKLAGYRLGLLINFNVPLIKEGITRIAL